MFFRKKQKGYNIADRKQSALVMQFGNYPQTGKNPEPIEWLLLESDGRTATMLSRYVLDCQQFHHSRHVADLSWETSDLRRWLKYQFFDEAFSDAEKQRILPTATMAEVDPKYNSKAGRDTADKAFLLSVPDVTRWFIRDTKTRIAVPTPYALSKGVNALGLTCRWWTRTPALNNHFFGCVNYDGDINDAVVTEEGVGVRPAIRISLI